MSPLFFLDIIVISVEPEHLEFNVTSFFFINPVICHAMRSLQGLCLSRQGTKKREHVGIGAGRPCSVTVDPHGGPRMEMGQQHRFLYRESL